MMGAISLNSLLATCTPVKRYKGDGKDEMPEDFAKTYFHEVGIHGEALW